MNETTSEAPAILPAQWITIAEATKLLGRSYKTVERLVSAGHIKTMVEPRAGRKPERLYDSQDVSRLAERAMPRANGSVAASEGAPPDSLAIRKRPAPPSLPLEVLQPVVERMAGAMEQTAAAMTRAFDQKPEPAKLWLSLEEAAAYTGLSKSDLKRARLEGKVTALRSGRGWRYRRVSLDDFAG